MANRKRAFTIVEVMVAVAILALTATAAIKLVILGQIGLGEAKIEAELTEEAKAIRTGIMLGTMQTSGSNGDIMWETNPGTRKMFQESFGKVDFSDSVQTKTFDTKEDMRWRELKVINTKRDRNIVIYLPHD
ncbi:MAG: prepilin-type N-terminal cleavage/methylation domain-containing protein [Synergistaceae bacterium]|nr:prepilin-type N-terminal cleavage/methylation domain-containing protein [Synergistaceae bacterium]